MKILFIGDVFGKVGRTLLIKHLAELKKEHQIAFVVANGENATHGKSLSFKHYQALKDAGVDVFTMGNHIFAIPDTLNRLNDLPDLLRPLNYEKAISGFGTNVFKCQNLTIRITNLLGRVFMRSQIKSPFLSLKTLVEEDRADLHFVDFHAEATAEKAALAWAFDGKITGLLGTHTHVLTGDARLLPQGTFFLSDLGMTGAHDSIIGAQPNPIVTAELNQARSRILPAHGRGQLSGMILEIDPIKKVVVKWQQVYQIFS